MTLAHLITLSTYGTRLHGDARGSFEDRAGFVPRNRALESYELSLMRWPPFALDEPAREIVLATVREVCAHRGWALDAVHVRTEHVHAVLWTDAEIRRATSVIKAWCTRRVRERGAVEQDRVVWARGANATRLNEGEDVRSACDYVLHRQGARMAAWGRGE